MIVKEAEDVGGEGFAVGLVMVKTMAHDVGNDDVHEVVAAIELGEIAVVVMIEESVGGESDALTCGVEHRSTDSECRLVGV